MVDVRNRKYFDINPEHYKALEVISELTPENFIRFVRMAVEIREQMNQQAIRIASDCFRRETNDSSQ